MKRNKRALAFMLALLLILSLPLGAIAFAGGNGSGATEPLDEQESNCTTYNKHFGSIQEQPDLVPLIKVNATTGKGTASFVTVKDCVEVSFSIYTFDNTPEPYENQVHYDGISKKYDKAGRYTLEVQLPQCGNAQLDLYAGPIQETLNPGYGHDHLTLRAHLLYKGSTCTTPSPEPTPTQEPTPTTTSSPEPTPSQEPTPTATSSPEPTPSQEPTPTTTSSPEPTPSQEPTPTTTSSPEPTPSQEPTPTTTSSPEPTPSQEPTPTTTSSPEPTPSQEPTPTTTSSPEPTPSQEPTPTATSTPSPAPFQTAVSTPETTPTPEVSVIPSEPPQSPEPTEELIIIEEEPIPAGAGPGTAVDHASDGTDPEASVPLDTLPKTGQTHILPYYLLGSLAILTGVYLLMRMGRRQKPD